MPPLSNQRHEGFCRAVSRGEAASTAYGAVYHVASHVAEVNGSRLLRNAKVIDRVAELKGQAAKRTEKTVASLVADLDEVIEFARQCRNPAAMVAAVTAQARLLGLMAPSQLEILHRPAPLPTSILELTEEEWTAQFSTGPGPRPALTEGAKARKAEKRKMNGRPRDGNRDVVVAPAIAWDAPAKEIDVPHRGVIDLD
ncbi:Terminase small subunit [Rhizobium sp. Root1220]|nr:Terminase small subunit [Rhizobium sp. Root1220]